MHADRTTDGTAPVEREIKIPVGDLESVRGRLRHVGATLVTGPLPEHNTLFDFEDRRLTREGRALRLRAYDERWILTFKGRVSYQGAVKQREEQELTVSDGDVLRRILCSLDMAPVIRYEKVREIWRHGPVVVCLDHTPLGDFVELEGPEGALLATAAELELDPDRAVRASYLRLWAEHRARHPEAGHDMLLEP
jgi:adenylate cyclase class 2